MAWEWRVWALVSLATAVALRVRRPLLALPRALSWAMAAADGGTPTPQGTPTPTPAPPKTTPPPPGTPTPPKAEYYDTAVRGIVDFF